MGTTSCLRAATRSARSNGMPGPIPPSRKSESTKATVRRRMALRRNSSAAVTEVPGEDGRACRISDRIRSTWRRPLRGGTNCSIRSVKSTSPTWSLFATAQKASRAASSAATSALVRSREPKSAEAEMSTRSITVSSRSSTNRLT